RLVIFLVVLFHVLALALLSFPLCLDPRVLHSFPTRRSSDLLPFLVLTFFLGSTKWIVRHSGIIMKVGGVIMIIMGLVLFTGQMPRISEFLLKLVEGTWLEKLG